MDGLSALGLCCGTPVAGVALYLFVRYANRTGLFSSTSTPRELANMAEAVNARELRIEEQKQRETQIKARKQSDSEIASWPSRRAKVLKLIHYFIKDQAERGRRLLWLKADPRVDGDVAFHYPLSALSYGGDGEFRLSANGLNEFDEIVAILTKEGYKIEVETMMHNNYRTKAIKIEW